MKNEVSYAITKLDEAITRLKEGVSTAKDSLGKDGVIQRFEFTFELLWKCLKIFLADQGIECRTPKESLKNAFKIGLIQDEETFLNMLDDRNKSSHTYSKEESEKIFENIKSIYVLQIENLLARLKK